MNNGDVDAKVAELSLDFNGQRAYPTTTYTNIYLYEPHNSKLVIDRLHGETEVTGHYVNSLVFTTFRPYFTQKTTAHGVKIKSIARNNTLRYAPKGRAEVFLEVDSEIDNGTGVINFTNKFNVYDYPRPYYAGGFELNTLDCTIYQSSGAGSNYKASLDNNKCIIKRVDDNGG